MVNFFCAKIETERCNQVLTTNNNKNKESSWQWFWCEIDTSTWLYNTPTLSWPEVGIGRVSTNNIHDMLLSNCKRRGCCISHSRYFQFQINHHSILKLMNEICWPFDRLPVLRVDCYRKQQQQHAHYWSFRMHDHSRHQKMDHLLTRLPSIFI